MTPEDETTDVDGTEARWGFSAGRSGLSRQAKIGIASTAVLVCLFGLVAYLKLQGSKSGQESPRIVEESPGSAAAPNSTESRPRRPDPFAQATTEADDSTGNLPTDADGSDSESGDPFAQGPLVADAGEDQPPDRPAHDPDEGSSERGGSGASLPEETADNPPGTGQLGARGSEPFMDFSSGRETSGETPGETRPDDARQAVPVRDPRRSEFFPGDFPDADASPPRADDGPPPRGLEPPSKPSDESPAGTPNTSSPENGSEAGFRATERNRPAPSESEKKSPSDAMPREGDPQRFLDEPPPRASESADGGAAEAPWSGLSEPDDEDGREPANGQSEPVSDPEGMLPASPPSTGTESGGESGEVPPPDDAFVPDASAANEAISSGDAAGGAASERDPFEPNDPSVPGSPAEDDSTAPGPEGDSEEYVVQPGDNYWRISKTRYGTPRYFKALARYNRETIPDPKKMRPGVTIQTPDPQALRAAFPELFPNGSSGTAARPASRKSADKPEAPDRNAAGRAPGFFRTDDGRPMYRVGPKDTLSRIAQEYLGRSARWRQIHEMNRPRLPDPHDLPVGTELRLPADASRIEMIDPAPADR